MNTVKKLFAFMLALALVLSLAVPAMADEHTEHTITINETNSGHEYIAYQIFGGNVLMTDSDSNPSTPDVKTLSNVTWGKNVDFTNARAWDGKNLTLVQALKDSGVNSKYYNLYAKIPDTADTPDDEFEDDKDIAAAVAAALATGTDTAHGLEFARIVTPYLLNEEEHAAATSEENKVNDGTEDDPIWRTTDYIIRGLSDGYYLVKEGEANVNGETKTSYILELIDSIEVTPKDGTVTVDKQIMEGREPVDVCSKNTGDIVSFEINATLPGNLNDFSEFNLTFVDTMESGLELVPDSVKAFTVNGNNVVEVNNADNAFYTVTPGADDHQNYEGKLPASLIVDFDDLFDLKNSSSYTVTTGTTIRVTYDAILTKSATIGGNGTTNEVYLKYSNNPYDPTSEGKTLPDVVHVFSFQLNVHKINGKSGAALPGVTFVVNREREGHAQYAVLDELAYNTITDPETNETTTTTTPYGGTVKAWTKWRDEEALNKHVAATHPNATEAEIAEIKNNLLTQEGVATVLTSNSTGNIYVKGMDLGTYWLEELKTNVGFNKIDPVEFEIKAGYDKVNNKVSGLAIIINNVSSGGDDDKGTVSTTVVNNPGNTLPTTGGMGTTLFYVVGAAMVLGAIVLLVTKKRMSN